MKRLVLLSFLVLTGCKEIDDYKEKTTPIPTPTIENEYRQVDGYGLLY